MMCSPISPTKGRRRRNQLLVEHGKPLLFGRASARACGSNPRDLRLEVVDARRGRRPEPTRSWSTTRPTGRWPACWRRWSRRRSRWRWACSTANPQHELRRAPQARRRGPRPRPSPQQAAAPAATPGWCRLRAKRPRRLRPERRERRRRQRLAMPLSVAIIGAGPAAFYTVEALLADSAARDVRNRHHRAAADALRADPRRRRPRPPVDQEGRAQVRAHGAGARGPASSATSRSAATSASTSCAASTTRWCWRSARRATGALGIPGEDRPGVYGSSLFVGWYNGHPDFRDLNPDRRRARGGGRRQRQRRPRRRPHPGDVASRAPGLGHAGLRGRGAARRGRRGRRGRRPARPGGGPLRQRRAARAAGARRGGGRSSIRRTCPRPSPSTTSASGGGSRRTWRCSAASPATPARRSRSASASASSPRR